MLVSSCNSKFSLLCKYFLQLSLKLSFAVIVMWSCILPLHSDTGEDLLSRWDQLSVGTKNSISTVKSTEVLEILRGELSVEKEKVVSFAEEQEQIITELLNQLEAFGPKLTDDEENSSVTNKRLELENLLEVEQQKLYRVNAFLNEFSQKIKKIDRIIRGRFSEKLFSMGPSPLALSNWQSFGSDLGKFVTSFSIEIKNKISVISLDTAAGISISSLFWLIVGGAILFWFYPTSWKKIREMVVSEKNNYKANLLVAANNLSQLFLPLLGITSILYAINLIPIFGLRGQLILDTAPVFLLYIVAGRWLALSLFSNSVRAGQLLEIEGPRAHLATRIVYALGVLIAFDFLSRILLSNNFLSLNSYSVSSLLVILTLSLLVFRLSRLLSNSLAELKLSENKRMILRILVSVATYASLVAPFVTIFGFFEAGRYLIVNLSITFFLFGVSYVLYDLFINIFRAISLFSNSEAINQGDEEKSFLPILVASGIVLINLPLIFLIWGGRLAELEIFWDKLNEGYSLGSTQINLSGFVSLIVIFIFGYLVTKFLQGILRDNVLPKTKLEVGGQKALVSGFGYIGNILAGLLAVSLVGLDLSSLAIIAGALSVGLGFGMQTVVSNFVSGIILLVERPIQEGDWIEVSGYSGTVQKISVRATHLETLDKAIVVVPNSAIITGTVLNWMHGDKNGRVSVPVEVAYGTDPEKVKKLLLTIASKHVQVLDEPEPQVVFRGFGESALQFELRAYIDTKFGLYVKSEINFEIAKAFEKNKIEIPFPQRDVNIRYAEAPKK